MANNIAVFVPDVILRRELIEFLVKYGYKLPYHGNDLEPYLLSENLQQYPFICADDEIIYQYDSFQIKHYSSKVFSLIQFVETVITQITKK